MKFNPPNSSAYGSISVALTTLSENLRLKTIRYLTYILATLLKMVIIRIYHYG